MDPDISGEHGHLSLYMNILIILQSCLRLGLEVTLETTGSPGVATTCSITIQSCNGAERVVLATLPEVPAIIASLWSLDCNLGT